MKETGLWAIVVAVKEKDNSIARERSFHTSGTDSQEATKRATWFMEKEFKGNYDSQWGIIKMEWKGKLITEEEG